MSRGPAPPPPVVIGFEVVDRIQATKTRIEGQKKLSRRFMVREAADQFAAIARKAGYPDAYVREVMGAADADPSSKRGRK